MFKSAVSVSFSCVRLQGLKAVGSGAVAVHQSIDQKGITSRRGEYWPAARSIWLHLPWCTEGFLDTNILHGLSFHSGKTPGTVNHRDSVTFRSGWEPFLVKYLSRMQTISFFLIPAAGKKFYICQLLNVLQWTAKAFVISIGKVVYWSLISFSLTFPLVLSQGQNQLEAACSVTHNLSNVHTPNSQNY